VKVKLKGQVLGTLQHVDW